MRSILVFAIVMIGFPLSVAAQTSSEKASDDQEQIERLLRDYKSTCVGSGSLVVFGQLIDAKDGKGIDGAEVSLSRNRVGYPFLSHTSGGGKYCINYAPGPDITLLRFQRRDVTCVQEIAGNFSHFINKLFDNSCSALWTSASILGEEETREVFGSKVAKLFRAVQVTISNRSDLAVQLTSMRLQARNLAESNPGAKDGSVPKERQIAITDPELVAQIASRHEVGLALLRIGPIGLLTLPPRAPASAGVRILQTDLMSHPLIPASSSRMGVVFVSRPRIPKMGQAGAASASDTTFLELILGGNLLTVDREVTTVSDTLEVSGVVQNETTIRTSSQGLLVSAVAPVN